MIAHLRGVLLDMGADHIVLDVGGVGFRLFVSRQTEAALPSVGKEVSLHVVTQVREDALTLYGFATVAEKETFLLLTGVSGVGPRLAMAVLSSLSPSELVRAVATRDLKVLTRIPGIGKKTAERLFFELGDKLKADEAMMSVVTGSAVVQDSQPAQDAIEALVALGYSRSESERAVARILGDGSPHHDDASTLVRAALGQLMSSA
ncbi:MAG: Holliday junction branch migration protein RuvA [Limnochordia bacterium]|jgi:Holliday junction DNA helicase RuvA